MRIAFVGCGAAARPLAIAWLAEGHEIRAVIARTTAAAAVDAIGAGVANGSLDDAEVVIFGTPDDALAAVAQTHELSSDQVAIHLSGAHPSTALMATGARTAGLHPLCAFADVETSLRALPDTWYFVEGEAVDVAESLARDLGPHVVRVDTEHKTLYHAAAAIASNYTVTLLALARELFARAGVDKTDGLAALVQLVRGSVDNVGHVGIPAGLTGPIARGDVELVRAHVEALPAQFRALYLDLLRATLPIARSKGGLSPDNEAALRALLSP